MKIDLKILDARLRDQLPQYATPGSGGLDLRACMEAPLTLNPGHALDSRRHRNKHCRSRLRSDDSAALGAGHKHGIVLGNLVGLIDSDYQGQIFVSTWNRGNAPFVVNPLERLAQLVVIPVMQVAFNIVDEFSLSSRGGGGFGSTGKG